MKVTVLVAAAALACGTAAFAQQSDTSTSRGEESARVDQQDHGTANEKMRSGAHRLGEKTRSAMHRLNEKMHHVAKRDHKGEAVARRDHRDDTRAMGGPAASHDETMSRQQRMDEAYAHWKAREDKNR